MEACFGWHDARSRWIRRVDSAGADADQFIVARVCVCGDVWIRIDRRDALDVGIDWFAFRVHLRKTHTPSSGTTNAGRRTQHLFWRLVRVQSVHGLRRRTLLLVGVVVVAIVAVWIVLARNCPDAGIALTANARNLHRLKNRTAIPHAADFDSRVTLDALLQPGDDSSRWSNDRAARVQGQVIDVAYARPEATNCFNPCRRDIHIVIAKQNGVAKTEQIVVEVTPNLREWATRQGIDWSEQTLQAQLVGHWCEFEGWLYFDAGHAEESENIHPQQVGNWRATAWEIHPVTKITVIR
jgi:hypothetical protein